MQTHYETAVERIESLRDRAQEYVDTNDAPGVWLDSEGSWVDWEAECEAGAAHAQLDAYIEVLAILRDTCDA